MLILKFFRDRLIALKNPVHWIYGISILAIIFSVCFRKIMDADTFWHLRVGELAFRNPTLLETDPFSFTFAGAPWPYKDLIADMILWGGYHAIGDAWLFLLRAACLASIGLALWTFETNDKRDKSTWLISFGLLAAALGPRILDRPLLFSLAIFPWFLIFLRRALLAERFKDYLPLIFCQWLWLVLHREGLIGVVLITVCLTMNAIFIRKKDYLKVLMAILLSFVVCLINPYGITLLTSALKLFQSSEIREVISEWKKPKLTEVLHATLGFTILVGATLLVFLAQVFNWLKNRRIPTEQIWIYALWLFFVVLYSETVRWTAFLSIISTLVLLTYLASLQIRKSLQILLPFPLFVLAFVTNPYPLGFGEDPTVFPKEALQFAEDVKLKSNVINFYDFGGYIIGRAWPQFKVAVDGRAEQVYPISFIHSSVQSGFKKEGFDLMLPQLIADWVLASNTEGHTSHQFLKDDPEWAMVFWSEPAVIYVKREAYPELKSQFFEYLPVFLDSGKKTKEILEAVERKKDGLQMLQSELERVLVKSRSDIRIHLWLAIVENRLGLIQKSEERMHQILQDFRGHPALQQLFYDAAP